jgi:hypothetical protein
MASICKEVLVDAPAGFIWDAIRDVGAIHTRLAQAFVLNTQLEGECRLVTFANRAMKRTLEASSMAGTVQSASGPHAASHG